MQLKPAAIQPVLPPEAARLRVALPDPYVYKSAWKRGLAWCLDWAGQVILGGEPHGVDWAHQDRIAVLRLDHLGDLLHALPALRRLRLVSPRARIDLWVGPWGQELASLFADVDTVRVTPAGWFARPHRQEWPWKQIWSLASGMNKEHYSAAVELRGDLRHHMALRLAGIPVRAGQSLTAGIFLLTHPAVWQPDLHEQEQGLSVLDGAWVPSHEQGESPYLKLPVSAWEEAESVAKELQLGPRPIVVQAACGTNAKRWSQESWAEVLQGLPADVSVVLLGSEGERVEMEQIARRVQRPVAVAAGRLSLSGLAALISTSRLMLSVDSGPAHLAAVQGVPVVSLFSGTNRATQWAPKAPGPHSAPVQVLQAAGLPCSPCELSDCPYGNACMNAISVTQVLAAAQSMLGGA